jgi:hypothetical protein
MNPEILTAKKWYRWLWFSPLLTIPSVVSIYLNGPGYELICGRNWQNCDYYLVGRVDGLAAILGSALWHLVLLVPALNKQSEFVRWHGRQALLLAGIRTTAPLAFLTYGLFVGGSRSSVLWSIPVLIAVWLFGTLWGQGQAARGDCSLMRWTGHGVGLPLPTGAAKPAAAPDLGPLSHERPDYRTAYYQGLSLREQGRSDEAVRVFHTLLVSDATPELKVRVVEELNRIGSADESLTADVLVAIFRFSHNPEQRRMALAGLERLGLVEPI